MRFLSLLLAACLFLIFPGPTLSAERAAGLVSKRDTFYVGTYTGAKSKGIHVCRFDPATGEIISHELAAETTSPSFLAIHPSGRFVYSANEINEFKGKPGGVVTAFAVSGDGGKLVELNQQSSGGAGPCYVVVDRAGKNVLVANYGGGSVAVLPLESDGKLREASAWIQHTGSSVNPDRQKEPHAHSINLDPANRFAFAADLGLDKIFIYRFDSARGTLLSNEPAFARVKPGAGPRHFAFHPTGRYAYVINELHSTVTAFACDPERGELKEIQSLSTLPSDQTSPGKDSAKNDNSTAEVQVHPSGRFLYGSNRGHNSIVACTIDPATGKLARIENESTQGRIPRNFSIDPSGNWLLAANQQSDSIVVFHIDTKTGALEPAGHRVEIGSPVCIKFLPPR